MKKLLILLAFLGQGSLWASPLKLGVVLDKGGRDDKSFNTAAYQGAQRAEKELGYQIKVVEAMDDNAFEPLLRAFATRDFDLIVGVGVSQAEAIKKVAEKFPDKRFAIVDAQVDAPNVRSLMFEEHEGSYLVGAIAAMKSKTGKIGFIGGMDIPLIRRFEKGFEAGAQKINPKIKLLSNYVGVTSTAWNNPPKAKELALSQYQSGADVVFSAAGASNMGVFDAAEEKKKFAIGVDSNQNWVKPGFILTSMLKRVDLAVFKTCEVLKNGKFTAGMTRYGLTNDGIDYVVDEYNKNIVTAEMIKKVNELKSQIVDGQISVPDYYRSKR
jgi:basic membrane protein A